MEDNVENLEHRKFLINVAINTIIYYITSDKMKPKKSALYKKSRVTKLKEEMSFRKGVNGQLCEISLARQAKCLKIHKYGNWGCW